MVCGGLRWFVVVCGGLWWFVVDCGGLSFSHTLFYQAGDIPKSGESRMFGFAFTTSVLLGNALYGRNLHIVTINGYLCSCV